MPPQNTPNPQSPSSSGQYDFIYNDGEQKPTRRLRLPTLSGGNLPKLVGLLVAGAVILIILIIIFSNIFLGTKVNTDELVSVMARGQEVARVSDLASRDSRDINTQGLAATTSNSLNSDQAQITAYLSSIKKKVDKKKLRQHENKKTDDELKAAAQNGNLEATYLAYLKKNLTDYRDALKTAFGNTPNKAKLILDTAYVSSGTILSSPQLASIP